jgi:hypothetical protein
LRILKEVFFEWVALWVLFCFKIRKADPDDKFHMVRFVESFEICGYLCIVTEMLGLYNYK